MAGKPNYVGAATSFELHRYRNRFYFDHLRAPRSTDQTLDRSIGLGARVELQQATTDASPGSNRSHLCPIQLIVECEPEEMVLSGFAGVPIDSPYRSCICLVWKEAFFESLSAVSAIVLIRHFVFVRFVF